MAEAKIKTEPEDPPVIKVEDLVSDSEDSDSVASQPIPKKQKIETITSANELGEGSSTSGFSVKTEIKEEPEDNSEYSMEFDETGAVKDEPNTSDEEDDDDFDEDEDQDVEDIEELKFEAEDESLLDKGKHSIKLEPKDEVPQSMTNEKQNTYNCASCEFSTTEFQKYLSHTIFCKYPRTPTKVNHTLCPYCNLKVNSDLALESHVFSKHKELNDVKEEVELTEFKCNKCSYKTSKLEEYILHYGTHKNCPYCGKQFISTKGLQGHVLGKHKIQNEVENKFALIYKTYECAHCTFVTMCLKTYKKHSCLNVQLGAKKSTPQHT